MPLFSKRKAPNVRETIIKALEDGRVLTHGSVNELTKSAEGGRTIRSLRQEGYPIEERWRPNKLRKGQVKEFFYSEETIRKIREERGKKAKALSS